MAWLQNLADKAEDLLNKVDKTAATVLNESNLKPEILEQHSEFGSGSQHEEYFEQFLPHMTTSNALKLKNQSPNHNVVVPNKNDDIAKEESSEFKVIENMPDNAADTNALDKSKYETSSFKSSSSHNSLYLYEDLPNLNEKIGKLEEENDKLNKRLLNMQHLCSELKNENLEFKVLVENSNSLAASAYSEMEEYKIRAQRILQEKEKLIGLKDQQNSSEDLNNTILNNYNNELKRELEFQQIKNDELAEKNKTITKEVSFLHKQIAILQSSLQQVQQNLEESLLVEKRMRAIAEEECRINSQELNLKEQELLRREKLLVLKDNELKSLKESVKQSVGLVLNEDFESRIRTLTDTLMLKQNKLEAITTDRNALKIQLEKLENEYHNTLSQLQRAQVRVINVNDTDDVKSQVPQFMRVSPLDAGVTRRVKHAYSTLDAISIRTGIFLRRYPVARVGIFCYMVLLQLWAFFILFLYAPSNR